MSWLDLEEGILEEFAARTPDIGVTHAELVSSFRVVEGVDIANARSRECKAGMTRRGLCTDCGKESDRKDKLQCKKCADVRNARWRERHSKHQKPKPGGLCAVCGIVVERTADTCSKRCAQAKRYKDNVAAGICVRCKVKKTKQGVRQCTGCLSKHKIARDAVSVLNCQDKSRTLAG
jgi:hypothetical protein